MIALENTSWVFLPDLPDYLSYGDGKGNPLKFAKWLVRKLYGPRRILKKMDRFARSCPVEGAAMVGCISDGYRLSDMMPADVVREDNGTGI